MNFGKANHHHTLAGMHLSKGNAKQAAHHLGHALSALRTSAKADEPEAIDTPAEEAAEAAPATPMSLKMRLSKMRGSAC